MREMLGDPERWSARPPGRATAEDRFARGFRAAAATPPLDDQAFARVRRTLREKATRPGLLRRTTAVVALVLATGVAGAWAGHGFIQRRWQQLHRQREMAPKLVATPTNPAPAQPAADVTFGPALPSAAARSSPNSSPDRRPSARQRKIARAAALPPVRQPNATSAPTTSTEAALLALAFRRLRVDHDAAAAIALFEEHTRRFPDGVLRPEASLGRVEALVRLGRRDEARAATRSLPLEMRREAEKMLTQQSL